MSAPPRPWTGLTPEQSTPGDFALPHPEKGAPNVVLVVLDDTRLRAARMLRLRHRRRPHIDRLAADGLRYNRFHVTALCSPTRACLLTGRNHHAVGMGFLADMPTAYPGLHGTDPEVGGARCRDCCATRATTRSRSASGTSCPAGERSHAGPFDRWPLGFGFERYYGFLQGDTNQWAPEPRPRQPLRRAAGARPRTATTSPKTSPTRRSATCTTSSTAAPDRPFFLYFALGAMHAPHHVAPEWVEPYRGRFDGGWERWRERRLRAPGRGRHRPRRHRALGTAARGCRTGTRSATTSAASTRASKRCSPAS